MGSHHDGRRSLLPSWCDCWLGPNRTVLAFWAPSGLEIVVILVVALLIFGKRIPDIARRLGQSINEFKRGMRDTTAELEKQPDEPVPSEQPGKKS